MTGKDPKAKAALDAASLSKHMAASLARDADPQLKDPSSAIALACHAGMLALDFTLVGLGEEHTIEAHLDPDALQPLPAEWNASPDYALRYKHSQLSTEIVVSFLCEDTKTVVLGMTMEDQNIAKFDITTKDFVLEAALPASPAGEDTPLEDVHHAIQTIFISPSRLTNLGSLLRTNVVQKLAPSLQKEEAEKSSPVSEDKETQQVEPGSQPRRPVRDPDDGPKLPRLPRPNPLIDPLHGPGTQPMPGGEPMPGFDDEHEMLARPRRLGPGSGPGPFFDPNAGEDDWRAPPLMQPGGVPDPFNPLAMPGRGRRGMIMRPEDLDPQQGHDDFSGIRYDPPGPFGAPHGSGGPGRGGFGGFGGPGASGGGGWGGGPFI